MASSKYFKAFFLSIVLFLGIYRSIALGGDFFQYDQEISGKILNFDTREPMEGVVVSCVWFYDQFRLTEAPKKEFYDYFETLTDQDGNFRIPGKGMCILRDIYPPNIIIFKAGYSVLYVQNLVINSGQVFPSSEEVNWIDSKAIVLFRKKTLAERLGYFKSHTVIPLYEMMGKGFPAEKIQLYIKEREKESEISGME